MFLDALKYPLQKLLCYFTLRTTLNFGLSERDGFILDQCEVDQNSSALVASSSVDMIRSDPILNEARLNQRKMKFVVQR